MRDREARVKSFKMQLLIPYMEDITCHQTSVLCIWPQKLITFV